MPFASYNTILTFILILKYSKDSKYTVYNRVSLKKQKFSIILNGQTILITMISH